jgi:hypothetical protein
MATIIVLNVLIAAIGVAIVAGGMRYGYLVAGDDSERSGAPRELEAPSELRRAA